MGGRPAGRGPAKTGPDTRRHTRYGLHVSKKSPAGFGRYLARRMVARGYESNSALGRDLGVNPSDIGRWISGETQPSVERLRKLAPVLDVPVLELLIEAGHITRREVVDSVRRMNDDQPAP